MSIYDCLNRFGQDHLLRYADSLSPEDLENLVRQLEEIDFEQLDKLTSGTEASTDWAALAAKADPPVAVRPRDPNPKISAEDSIAAGEAALRSGKIGMILVAGGQGTRLGFDKPKGMFPIGPLSNRTLFQMHCDRLLAVVKRYDVQIPLYVMTSPATDEATRKYFKDSDRCGLAEEQLKIFCQGSMPAVDDTTGKILLASKSQIALSPDGHGGLVAALQKRGCLEDARQRGIEHFYYAQVDNPMANICEPELIGYHLLGQSPMTTQAVMKRFAKEKVGNVVQIDGKTMIIEYSDLPDDTAEQTNEDGSLKFWAGNIAIHVFRRDFLESVVESADGLPFHRAHKPVAFIGESGELNRPEKPNAIKFERFVFDLLPLAEGAIVVEADAARVFAPVKNADGGDIDTPADTKSAILAQHRRWLVSAGAKVPTNIKVEIHPDWALDEADVQQKIEPNTRFETDTFLR